LIIVASVQVHGSAGNSGFEDGSSIRYFSCLALPKSGTSFPYFFFRCSTGLSLRLQGLSWRIEKNIAAA
jgi:hypothetical protein